MWETRRSESNVSVVYVEWARERERERASVYVLVHIAQSQRFEMMHTEFNAKYKSNGIENTPSFSYDGKVATAPNPLSKRKAKLWEHVL